MNDVQVAIIQQIKKFDTIIIHRHQRPDPDAIGSQCGLKEIIGHSFPDKRVLAAGSGSGSLSFLGQMDQVAESDYQDALVIVTDTANAGRVDGEAYSQGRKIIKIDHHPDNPDGDYADLTWVEDFRSSCSEMVADLALQAEDLSLSDEAARLLYAGIVGDTNRFLYDATSPRTMEIAGQLMTYDFDHTALNDQMNRIQPAEAQLMGYALNELTVMDSGMAYLILSQETLDGLGLGDDQTHSIVSLPRMIDGVVCWGIFVQQADGSYRCRLRSSGPRINQIAQEHDGGGHALASGANAKDEEEIQEIVNKMAIVAEQFMEAHSS